ncbi:MAG: hypothetical protein JXR86_02255 [Spirochaetales bacterium]|nr:hypothetical protein [Spirochaetales bacterium]
MVMKRHVRTLAINSLTEALDIKTMLTVANLLMTGYDSDYIYNRTGFPRNMPMPPREVARQIIDDVNTLGLYLEFVTILIRMQEEGLKSRQYRIPYLRELLNDILEQGYIYEPNRKMFIEDPDVRRTPNWGVLRADEDTFSFLRVDIVGNSDLVRKYPSDLIRSTYSDFKNIVTRTVEKRNARIWNWEGDGGLAAFYFGRNIHQSAVLSGMEILHQLFMYNRLSSRLDEILNIRIAVHSGPCHFCANPSDLDRSETIMTIKDLEKNNTDANSLSISRTVHVMLDPLIVRQFDTIKRNQKTECYNYRIRWEEIR